MLFKKKELKIDIHKGQVQCKTCKHWIDKEDIQEVRINGIVRNWNEYYCPMHKKPYDSVVAYGERGIYYRRINASIEVDKNGKPIDKNWYKKLWE